MFDANTNMSAVALNLIAMENGYSPNATTDGVGQNYAREKHKTEKMLNFNGRGEYVDDAIPNHRTQDAIAANEMAAVIDENGSRSHSHSRNKNISANTGRRRIDENDDLATMRAKRTVNERKRHLKQRLMLHNDANLNVNNRRNIQFQRYAQ